MAEESSMILVSMMEQDSTDAQNQFGATSKSVTNNDERFKALGVLARELVSKQRELSDIEDALKDKAAEVARLSEVDIPNAMAEIGMAKFTLDDGTSVSVKDDVYANIKVDNRDTAHAWLDAQGFGDVIKNDVVVSFGKGESDKVEALVEVLDSNGAFSNWARKEAVHASTLKALVREQLAQGNTAFLTTEAEDLLGVRQFKKTIIK